MKNFFGIIFILGGVVLIGVGIVALTDNHTRSQTFGDKWQSSFDNNYSRQKEEQQMIGTASAGGGAALLVVGLIMVSIKSKSTKNKEAELAAMKNLEAKKQKEKQLIIKAEAEAKAKLVAEENQKLADMESKEKIEIAPEIATADTQESTVKVEGKSTETDNIAKVEQQKKPLPVEDDLESKLSKIERLGELKEKGLLTDEEFAAEKKKILEA